MNRRTLVVLLSCVLSSIASLRAVQPGMIDPAFKTGSGTDGAVSAMVRQKDGKILIGGSFSVVQGFKRNRICRLLSSGVVDASFNPGDGVSGTTVNAIAVQADGKVLIGGFFAVYNGTTRPRIARLNADGSLDASFNPGSGTSGIVNAIAVQADGKVLIGGPFTGYNGVGRNRIARLNTDGSLDTGFNPGTGADAVVSTVAVQVDGKVLIGGSFTSYNGVGRSGIARLNTDGSLDGGFNPGTGANGTVNAVAVQADGKALIGGSFTSYNGTGRSGIARLNTDGSLDGGFNPGTGANGTVNAVAVQAGGKTLIGGSFTSYNGTGRNNIARLNADGSPDISFNPGIGADSGVGAVAVQADGKVLIGGNFTNYNGAGRNHVARLNTNGSLDASFNPGTGANNNINAVAVQANGKVLIGGNFTSYNGTGRNYIARLNADGSLDISFNPGTGADGGVTALAMQADGKVLIGGSFSTYNGVGRNHIARLNADGSLDSSFDPGTGASNVVYAMAMQADGKVLIGGGFGNYNGTARGRIARLNVDGSLDSSFNPGTGADSAVNAVAVQTDGKVLIGGAFTSYNGTGRNSIARLNTNGSLDTGFNPGTGVNGPVTAVAAQTDGKVLIGGFFTSYNGTGRNNIARLNTNGSVDTGFNPGTGADNTVNAMAVQVGGKVLIGGLFTSYDGTGRNSIARVNPDGSLDTGFNPGSGAASNVIAIALQADGKALIGGLFNTYDGVTANCIARVYLAYQHQATTFTGITSPASLATAAQNAALMGKVTVSLTKTGVFTGSLSTGAETIPFTGFFDWEGRCVLSAPRKDQSLVLLDLALARGSSGGAVVEGVAQDFAGRSVEFVAHAPFFSSGLLPANHFSGKYQVAMQTSPSVFTGPLPVSGAGFLTGTVSTSGAVAVVGKAADGSVLSASVNLTQDGDLLLHFPLYAGKGFINGIANINDTSFTPVSRPVTGNLSWLRPANTTYPQGFTQTLACSGGQYLPRAGTLRPFGGTQTNSVHVSIGGGHMTSLASSDASFSLTGSGVVVAGGLLPNLKVSVNRAAGSFSGSFLPPGSTQVAAIQGVIVSNTLAVGYTLVNVGGVVLPANVTLSVMSP